VVQFDGFRKVDSGTSSVPLHSKLKGWAGSDQGNSMKERIKIMNLGFIVKTRFIDMAI
jgi:hypothetical protein